MIVYLARDIPAFVMYCVNGESGSSLLIESTISMILAYTRKHYDKHAHVLYIQHVSQVHI